MLECVQVPANLKEAIVSLENSRAAAVLSGGTLLMPQINTKPSGLQVLVSTRHLGLSNISVEGTRATVGATATLDAFGRDSRLRILRPVIESIASPPIRNMATVGGNLFAPQPHGDLAVALLALDAVVEIAGTAGRRQASVAEMLKKGISAAEIVTSVSFDIPAGGDWFYVKAMRRKFNSAAIVTVAAHITFASGVVRTAQIALGGAGPRPVRAPSAEAALLGHKLDLQTVQTAALAAAQDVEPFTDAYASAWYRARVLPIHIRRAFLGA